MNSDAERPRRPSLPAEPIQRIADPLARFLHVEAASGVILLIASATALILANSSASDAFLGLWKLRIEFAVGSFQMSHSLQHWINDGLMALFFFVIGLEVKRELTLGRLRDLRSAALPIAAAIGGMVVPAGMYIALQPTGPAAAGWGIPMATDIAFVVGCMAVLGPRVPGSLRILLLSLAIADDIGAILVIAIGYTDSLNLTALALGIAGIGAVALLARLGVRSVGVYGLVGLGVWLAFHASGVHATIAGVILGLQTPSRSWVSSGRLRNIVGDVGEFLHGGGWDDSSSRRGTLRQVERAAREAISPLERLETLLHPWVSFGIMPIFALANAGVPFEAADFASDVAVAVAVGLLVGKPVGILLASFLAVRMGLARMPDEIGYGVLTAGGCLAGIGFTMALFIAGLALSNPELDQAKVGILGASALAAVLGLTLLVWLLPAAADAPRPGAVDQ